jgi:hypothetical protein
MNILSAGTARQIDLSAVVTKVQSPAEARSLPVGTVVGDVHGGVTFSDRIAAELERRSREGWCDAVGPDGEAWTVIVLAKH